MFTARWMDLVDLPQVLHLGVNVLKRNPQKMLTSLQRRDRYAAIVVEHITTGVSGYVLYRHNDPNAVVIRHICVDPSKRRKGAGTELVKFLMGVYANAKTSKPIQLVLSEKDSDTQAFFKTLGFKAARLLREHFKDGSDGYMFKYTFPVAKVEKT